MNTVLIALATLTGIVTGLVFGFLEVPIPAPPNLAGIMGIVGIFLGYQIMEYFDVGFDLLGFLGI
ncbi:MAG: XapX domain-containing protein [Haloarculaceae archaeon]